MLEREEKKRPSVDAIAERIRLQMAESPASVTDETVHELILKEVLGDEELSGLSQSEKKRLIRLVFCTLRCELEILQDLLDDPLVNEIMVNGPKNIFVERCGSISRMDIAFESAARLEQVIQRIAARVGREINELNPIVDARLSDGSRVNAVFSNVALDGPILTIRKFGTSRMDMEQLIEQGDISREAADFLKLMVEARYNIYVSGGTSSGKTTFLNILSDFIPPDERIIVIEDSAELQLRGCENLVRLEARAANAQGYGSVSIRELIKASLRMRPDRIIVGETRGEEVIDMLAAMSTGHDGSLSTGHANSPKGMLGRLETMVLANSDFPPDATRRQIAQAIELIVQLQRSPDGHRRVVEISEVTGLSGGEIMLSPLFVYRPGEGLSPTGNELSNTWKLSIMKSTH
jgi:pilus assembly protein CpaF